MIRSIVLIALACTACSRTQDSADNAQQHKQEILQALENCKKQGINVDYSPSLQAINCKGSVVNLKYGSSGNQ